MTGSNSVVGKSLLNDTYLDGGMYPRIYVETGHLLNLAKTTRTLVDM